MQFNDNSVPGKYQQPIGSFAGRIVSNDVEEVDFITTTALRTTLSTDTVVLRLPSLSRSLILTFSMTER